MKGSVTFTSLTSCTALQTASNGALSCNNAVYLATSTGSLKTFFDANYFRTSTGSLKALFDLQYLRTSTGSLQTYFSTLYGGKGALYTSTGSLKTFFDLQYLRTSTGSLKVLFDANFLRTSTGSLKALFDANYFRTTTGSLQTYFAKNFVSVSGDTMTGGLLIVNGGAGTATVNSNILLEIAGTASGRILRAQDTLASSGTLSVKGSVTFTGLASCTDLQTTSNGALSCNNAVYLATSTGSLRTFFDLQYLRTSTGSLKAFFDANYLRTSTGSLRTLFNSLYFQSSTGSLKTFFDAQYLRTSTGSLKVLFDANYFRTSTGSLKTFFDLQYLRTSTGSLKTFFDANYLRTSTGSLRTLFDTRYMATSTGSLKALFDANYLRTSTGSLRSSLYVFGQGFSRTAGGLVTLNQALTGSTLKESTKIMDSGSLVVRGVSTFSGQVIILNSAGLGTGNLLVVDTKGLVYDGTNKRVGIGTSSPRATLDVVGTVSGSVLNMSNIAGLNVIAGKLTIGPNTAASAFVVKGNSVFEAQGAAPNANTIMTIGKNGGGTPFDLTLGNAAQGNGLEVLPDVNIVTSTASNYYNMYGASFISVPGTTLSNYYGLYLDSITKTGTGTITTAYGLYVANPLGGATNFGGYIGGKTGIGPATPASMLAVSGSMIVSPLGTLDSIGADSGLAMEIIGTTSGRVLRAQDTLASSGTLSVKGSVTFTGLASCTALQTASNGASRATTPSICRVPPAP